MTQEETIRKQAEEIEYWKSMFEKAMHQVEHLQTYKDKIQDMQAKYGRHLKSVMGL